jgi:hypothetical protein
MPIFMSELVSIQEADDATPAAEPTPDEGTAEDPSAGEDDESEAQGDTASEEGDLPESLQFDPANGLPIFYLPMEGGVGNEFREEEIRAVGKEMDQLGPGQTLVLHISSGGGYVAEWQLIWQTIQNIKKKHRVIAWVKTAISAAASTSLACSGIVFETSGALGSITTLSSAGESSLAMQMRGVRELEEVLREGGYSKHFAAPFKLNAGVLSYDKDPETGAVTFYPDDSGDFILSDSTHVLTIDAREAEDCGFALGIADTQEELAVLLNMGGWNEVGTGQKIFDKWQADCKACVADIQRYGDRLQRLNTNTAQGLQEAITIIRKFLRWWDRTPNMCFDKLPSKTQLKLMLKEYLLRLQDIRRR